MGIENPFDAMHKALDSKEGVKTAQALEHDKTAIKEHIDYLYRSLKSQTDAESIGEVKAEITKYEERLQKLTDAENH